MFYSAQPRRHDLFQTRPDVLTLLQQRAATADLRKRYFLTHQIRGRVVQGPSPGRCINKRRAFSASDAEKKPRVSYVQRREVYSAHTKKWTEGSHRTDSSDSETEFNALNRRFAPLPKAFTKQRAASPNKFTKTNIAEWENEVTKVVPERPAYSSRVHLPSRPDAVSKPAPVHAAWANPSLFYRVDRRKSRGKEYTIYPDWASERRIGHIGFSLHKSYKLDVVRG